MSDLGVPCVTTLDVGLYVTRFRALIYQPDGSMGCLFLLTQTEAQRLANGLKPTGGRQPRERSPREGRQRLP